MLTKIHETLYAAVFKNTVDSPKIVYRSDSSKCTYNLFITPRRYVIEVVGLNDGQLGVLDSRECPIDNARMAGVIQWFFRLVELHINTGKWE